MSTTNGMALSRACFTAVWPVITTQLPDLESSLAAGLVGEGSECLGFDDASSRDHDWGPGFCLWLPREQFNAHKDRVREVLRGLPQEFEGHAVYLGLSSSEPPGRRGVLCLEDFYARFLGASGLPETWREWLRIPEKSLCACTNGEVFADNLGLFTATRNKLLAFYPEDLRLKKMAARCMGMAQDGQYNLPRAMRREHAVTAMLAAARFAEQAGSMIFLLNRRYAPFYKWMHRGLAGLPVLGQFVYDRLQDLAGTDLSQGPVFADKAATIVEDICSAVADELRATGLSDAQGAWLIDHIPSVQERIAIPELKAMPVSAQ